MGKLRVTPTCYVQLLNDELRSRRLAEKGWAFALASAGGGESDPTGVRFDGPATVGSAIVEAVSGKYLCCRPG